MIKQSALAIAMFAAVPAFSEPLTFDIDPGHTYPSFEADHQNGLSIWRGKINSNSGKIVLDRAAKTGTVDITMDMSTLDFGHVKMSEHAKGPEMLDVAKFPTATYQGTIKFNGDNQSEVEGNLTLHGVTKPVKLTINSFLCRTNAVQKRETCGADASATFNRDDFGVDYGKQGGFKMAIKLAIQVEARRSTG
jgi:polyisoprenoid-binding protein YceI